MAEPSPRQLQRRGLGAWIRLLGSRTPEARILEEPGVLAAVVPRCPQRSIANSGIVLDPGGLAQTLPRLAATYERAGVAASALWAVEHDPAVERALTGAGYSLDGEPAAMSAPLSEVQAPAADGLDWDASAEPAEVGRINDAAYGHPEAEGMGAAITGPARDPAVRSYRARLDGEVVSVLETIDVGKDCLLTWVATLPEHWGCGLASRLIGAALDQARERGLETTSLQASMAGRGVYERLGYEVHGTLRLYERRPPAGG